MSSVNKKFPKMDLLKLLYLWNLLWVSICQETGSCTLFFRASPLPFFFLDWEYSPNLVAYRKSSPVFLWATLCNIQLGETPLHIMATGSLRGEYWFVPLSIQLSNTINSWILSKSCDNGVKSTALRPHLLVQEYEGLVEIWNHSHFCFSSTWEIIWMRWLKWINEIDGNELIVKIIFPKQRVIIHTFLLDSVQWLFNQYQYTQSWKYWKEWWKLSSQKSEYPLFQNCRHKLNTKLWMWLHAHSVALRSISESHIWGSGKGGEVQSVTGGTQPQSPAGFTEGSPVSACTALSQNASSSPIQLTFRISTDLGIDLTCWINTVTGTKTSAPRCRVAHYRLGRTPRTLVSK